MTSQNNHANYELFCDELKDQGFLFEVWRMAREGEHAERDFKDRFWEKLNHVARKYPNMGIVQTRQPVSSDRSPQVETSSSLTASQGAASDVGDESQEFESARRAAPRGTPAKGGKSKRSLVLECLREAPEALRQVDLANKTGIKITALYNLVDDMKDNGLVTKTKSPVSGGKEVTVVGITSRGKDELDRNKQAYL